MSDLNPYQSDSSYSSKHSYLPRNAVDYNPIHSIDPVRLVTAPFASPNWLVNIVWMVGCELLAMVFIGNIIWLGYAGEVAMARSGGRKSNWPDFNIDRFGDYFFRGLWPTLWQLIGGMIALVLVGIPGGITALVTITLANNQQETPAFIIGAVGGALSFLIFFVTMLGIQAITIQSLFCNDFMKGVETPFIKAYIKTMIIPTILMGVCLAALAIVYSILGALACLVGVFLVGPVFRLTLCDAFAQLYDIHLSNGGPMLFDPNSAAPTTPIA